MAKRAAERRAEQWAENRRQRAEEERRQRVMVITEFDAGDSEATLHALADEILKYRLALRLLAQAIGWADAGAPFAIIPPGPYWHPKAYECPPGASFALTPIYRPAGLRLTPLSVRFFTGSDSGR